MENDPELKAIGNIIKELDAIPEDRRSAIIQFVTDRLNISIGMANKSKYQIERSSEDASKDVSNIKEFIDTKQPTNNYQLIACLGYYLEHFEQTPEYGAKELRDAVSRARRPPITNIARDIKNTQHQYKFITSGREESRKKMLTVDGEKIVRELPDQNAVRVIVKNARKTINKKYSKRKHMPIAEES